MIYIFTPLFELSVIRDSDLHTFFLQSSIFCENK